MSCLIYRIRLNWQKKKPFCKDASLLMQFSFSVLLNNCAGPDYRAANYQWFKASAKSERSKGNSPWHRLVSCKHFNFWVFPTQIPACSILIQEGAKEAPEWRESSNSHAAHLHMKCIFNWRDSAFIPNNS